MALSKYEQLRSKIRGPVYPIPPAFSKDFSVDYNATSEYVKFLNSHHVRTLLVTAGTSRVNLLTDEEIKELNRTVVEANQGKAVAIVANAMIGGTAKAVEFTRHAEEIGADAMLVYYPERYYNDDRIFDYCKALASNSDIGILIHSIPMKNAYAEPVCTSQFSLDLYQRLYALGNVIGMKEESGDETHRYKLATHLNGKMALIVAGASMRMLLSCVLFGVDAYLVGIGSFVPEIEEKFYQHVMDSDYKAALQIVTNYEEPFFDVAFPMGWHIAMKGAMDLLRLMPATERPPLHPANEQERKQLREVMTKLGWL